MSAPSLRTEAGHLWRLAWPVVLSQLGIVALGAEDVLMVGRLGETELAIVSAGHIFHFGVLMLGLGMMRGLDPIFAQAHGAGDRAAGAAALGRAVLVGLALSLPLAAVHWLAAPVLSALGQPPEVLEGAAAYSRLVGASVPLAMVTSAVVQFLQGLGQMKRPMVAVVIANVANIALDAVAVFGLDLPGVLSIPPQGAVGCGWATLGSRAIWLVVLLWLAWDVLRAYRPPSLSRLVQAGPLRRMLGLGVPVGLQTALEVWAFSAAGLLMGALGARELAAHAIALNIISITFMVPSGIGAAASTRVGNLVGAGQAWMRTGWLAVGMGVGWMALSASGLVLAPAAVASLYTDDAGVLALAARLLPVAAAFQLFDGVQAVSFGVLRGAGDVRVPALFNVVGYWIIGLPLGWWFGVHQGPDPLAVWGALALALVIVSTLLVLRLLWRGRVGAIVVARDG
jgi:MATE family multidrug resistance protein